MAQKLRPQAETLSGSPQPNFIGYQTAPILAKRAPTAQDTGYPLGQLWLDKTGDDYYGLVDVSAGVATWNLLAATPGEIATLSGDTGTATPSLGNIQIAGTANEIDTSASGSILTVGIPSTFSIGSSASSNSATILSGTGGITLTAANGDVEIDSGTGDLKISDDASDTSVFLGTGAGDKSILIGSSTGASYVTILSGSGPITLLNSSGMSINTGAGDIDISVDSAATDVNLGTGAGSKTVTIGSTNTTSATVIQSGSGDVSVSGGNLIIATAAKQLQVNGGAVTDFIGTATLTNGTVTIANTNLAAGDRIFIQRISVAGSTTLGELVYATSPGVNFTVNSVILGTPGSIQTSDQSTFTYFIVRQI